jgi:hypothetical protein
MVLCEISVCHWVVRRPDGNFRERRPLMARMKNASTMRIWTALNALLKAGALQIVKVSPVIASTRRR